MGVVGGRYGGSGREGDMGVVGGREIWGWCEGGRYGGVGGREIWG